MSKEVTSPQGIGTPHTGQKKGQQVDLETGEEVIDGKKCCDAHVLGECMYCNMHPFREHKCVRPKLAQPREWAIKFCDDFDDGKGRMKPVPLEYLINWIREVERAAEERVKMLIVEECNIARSEGEKTSRLTSLWNKIGWGKVALRCDDSTTYATVGHIYQSNFQGKQGRDRCLENFGEEKDECKKYNEEHEKENNTTT